MMMKKPMPCVIPGIPARFILLGLVFFVIIPGCGSKKGATSPVILEKVMIAHSATVSPTLLYIALIKGFLTARGIDATLAPHENGKLALETMLRGGADLAVSGDTPVMFAILGGRKISIISVVAGTKQNIAIVARKDRGINTHKDLRGKRIGVVKGTTMHYFLESYLSIHGIPAESVVMRYMELRDMSTALAQGRVDAVSLFNPWLQTVRNDLGEKGTVFFEDVLYSDIVCLTGRREYLMDHGETVKKTVMALWDAERYMAKNRDESERAVSAYTGIDRRIVEQQFRVSQFHLILDQYLLASLEDQTRWGIKQKLAGSNDMPNYPDFIYFQALESVRPESVRIIR